MYGITFSLAAARVRVHRDRIGTEFFAESSTVALPLRHRVYCKTIRGAIR